MRKLIQGTEQQQSLGLWVSNMNHTDQEFNSVDVSMQQNNLKTYQIWIKDKNYEGKTNSKSHETEKTEAGTERVQKKALHG